MSGETVAIADIFSKTPEPEVRTGEGSLVSISDVVDGGGEKPAGIPSIPDEQATDFVAHFGGMIHNAWARAAGSMVGGVADVLDTHKILLPLSPLSGNVSGKDIVRPWVKENLIDPLRAEGERIRAQASEPEGALLEYGQFGLAGFAGVKPTMAGFEKTLYDFSDALGRMPAIILSDVMAGAAIQMSLKGVVLPAMEAALAKVPNFVLGSGWRGFIDGIEDTPGGVIEKTVGGLGQAAENMSFAYMFAKSGTGLQGISKMMSLGLAESFYNATKEGRFPTPDEMIASTTQAGMMGLVFTALPHLVEGEQNPVSKKALGKYAKKVEALMPLEPEGLQIQFGKRQYPIASAQEASSKWNQIRDQAMQEIGPGAREASGGTPLILDASGKTVGYISWNGEVWKGEPGGKRVKWSEEAPKPLNPLELQKTAHDIIKDEKIRPEVREAILNVLTSWQDERGSIAPLKFKLGQWRDAAQLGMSLDTMERNIEKVARGEAKAVQAVTTEKVKLNETYHNRWRTAILTAMDDVMVKKGIRPNTEDSALTMRFGEKRMTLDELKAASPKNWENVVEAAKWSREIYDMSIDALNVERVKFGEDPIPKREDYFRHFNEVTELTETFGYFFSKTAMGKWADTKLAGIKRRGVAKKPFSSTELRREGGAFKEDAVLALQNYVKSAGPQLFHLDSVARICQLEQYIRDQAQINEAKMEKGEVYVPVDLKNFTSTLAWYRELLSGQKTDFTASVEKRIGRPNVLAIRAVSKNVTANMIAYNITSSIMNMVPLAQNAPFAVMHPISAVRGAIYAASHMEHDGAFEIKGARSMLNDRRYPKGFLPANAMEAVVNKGFALPNFIDRFVVRSLIAGRMFDGLRDGLDPKEAMSRADNITQRMVTDRSKGQTQLIFQEPELQLFTKFMTEQTNLWSWLKNDLPKEYGSNLAGKVGAWSVFSVASLVMNTLIERATALRPIPDPLYFLATLLGWTKAGRDRPFQERIQPALKQVGETIPFAYLFTDGGRFPVASAFPDVGKMVANPEYEIVNQMKKPLAYLVSPFGGGGQVKKTIEGLTAWHRGYVSSPSGKTDLYGVNKDFFNFMRGALFGKSSFPEAVEHWNKPKSEED